MKLENSVDLIHREEIDAVVDTGAVMTLLPEDIVRKLELRPMGTMRVTLADDQQIELQKAGPLLVTVCGRSMNIDCLVGPSGCEALLGQIVMEGLDLIPDPGKRTLTPRPESPDRPTLKMKSISAVSGSVS